MKCTGCIYYTPKGLIKCNYISCSETKQGRAIRNMKAAKNYGCHRYIYRVL